jgi:type VI secretion system protein VasD
MAGSTARAGAPGAAGRARRGGLARAALLLIAGLASAGAPAQAPAGPTETAGTPVELTIVGGPALNPNAQGRASPVLVRIFELQRTDLFAAADYDALFGERTAAPRAGAGDPPPADEFFLRPGDIQHRDRTAAPAVQALGIAAAFRELDHAAWRLLVPLHPGTRNLLLIDLDHGTIRQANIDAN